MPDYDNPDTPGIGSAPRPHQTPARQESDFGQAFLGILTAGAIYECLIALTLLAIFVARYGVGRLLRYGLEDVFIGFAAFFIFFSITLTVVVVPLALFALSLVITFLRSVKSNPPWSVAGGLAGGLTGFAAILCAFPTFERYPLNSLYLSLLLGPVLATVLGQAGGCWNTLAPQRQSDSTARTLHFDIRQVMIATVWVAATLTVLKLLGALGIRSGSILIGGLMLQAITLPLVIRAVRRVREGSAT